MDLGSLRPKQAILHLRLISEEKLARDLLPQDILPDRREDAREESRESVSEDPPKDATLSRVNPEDFEAVLDFLASLEFELAVFPPGGVGSHLVGRLAARTRGSAALDVEKAELSESGLAGSDASCSKNLVVTKMVYAQNLKAAATLTARPFFLTPSSSLAASAGGKADRPPNPASESRASPDPDPESQAPKSQDPRTHALKTPNLALSYLDLAKGKPVSSGLVPLQRAGDLAEALVAGVAGLGGGAGIELMARLPRPWEPSGE